MGAFVTFKNVKKIYSSKVIAVNDFNLDVKDKEFIVFVGPSGCGKSTTLRMIAGLEDISEGIIKIDDVIVNDLQPKDRDIAMVFQNYALYPHLSVFENIACSKDSTSTNIFGDLERKGNVVKTSLCRLSDILLSSTLFNKVCPSSLCTVSYKLITLSCDAQLL